MSVPVRVALIGFGGYGQVHCKALEEIKLDETKIKEKAQLQAVAVGQFIRLRRHITNVQPTKARWPRPSITSTIYFTSASIEANCLQTCTHPGQWQVSP